MNWTCWNYRVESLQRKMMHCYLLALSHHLLWRRHSGSAKLQTWNSFLCKMLTLGALTKAKLFNYWTKVGTAASIFVSENISCNSIWRHLSSQKHLLLKPSCLIEINRSSKWTIPVNIIWVSFPLTQHRILFVTGVLVYEK